MKNRKLITYEIQTVIVTKDKRGKEQYFEATDLQKKQILEVERHVLHNIMGYEKMFQVFIRFQQADFYQQVNDLLYQQYGWNHYFKQIKVIYTFDGVKEALPELEKNKAEYQQQMKNLIDEYWGDNPRIETHKKKMWNPPDTYLDAQSILTDELIRIGHKDRTFSMEEFLESNSDID